MKKFLSLVICLIVSTAVCFADDAQNVLKRFDSYVNASNTYSATLPSYYINNAKIIRVVNKKGGGQQSVVIPFDRFIKELNNNAKFAKLVSYKNRYENRKIVKIDANTYKVSAMRYPRNDKTGLGCYFVFTKSNGTWKIKEESMTTNVQTFLTAK